MLKTKLDLYTSYCKQLTNKGKKADWILFNKNDEEIHRFPPTHTESQIFEMLDFAKKFEEIAFNKGIDFLPFVEQNKIKALESVVRQLKRENEILLTENERIGGELDKLITFKEN